MTKERNLKQTLSLFMLASFKKTEWQLLRYVVVDLSDWLLDFSTTRSFLNSHDIKTKMLKSFYSQQKLYSERAHNPIFVVRIL